MPKEFTSKDQDFSARTGGTYQNLMFLVPTCGLAIVALGYGIIYHEGRGKTSKAGRISEGLSYMDKSTIFMTLAILLIVLTGLILFLKSYYKNREIVVELKFNDSSKELTIKTRTIHGKEHLRIHKYTELSVESNYRSDGMTSPMYETLSIVKGKYLAGHIYKNHFTWDSNTFLKIKESLKIITEANNTQRHI